MWSLHTPRFSSNFVHGVLWETWNEGFSDPSFVKSGSWNVVFLNLLIQPSNFCVKPHSWFFFIFPILNFETSEKMVFTIFFTQIFMESNLQSERAKPSITQKLFRSFWKPSCLLSVKLYNLKTIWSQMSRQMEKWKNKNGTKIYLRVYF